MSIGGGGEKIPDGEYTIEFWIVNSKGAASESETREITVKDGKIIKGLDSYRVDNRIPGKNVFVAELDKIETSGAATGSIVEVIFIAEELPEEKADEAAEISKAETAAGKSLEYFDFSLIKKTDGVPENIGGNNDVLLAISLPFPTDGKSDFGVYRYHDNKVEELPENPAVDSEGFSVRENGIVIYAKKFSAYAIAYKEDAGGGDGSNNAHNVGAESDSTDTDNAENAGDSSADNEGQPETNRDAEPKTGDHMSLELSATLAMISGMAYLLLYFTDDRYGMKEETKRELVAKLIAWAKRGGRVRMLLALAVIFLLLVYYHSIGKKTDFSESCCIS